MLKYPARHYDEQLRLRVSPLLWVALIYGVRHFFLLAASKLMPLESAETPWIALQAHSGLLWADLLALGVLIATGHRIPDALRVMRWLWCNGRGVLVAAYLMSITGYIGLNHDVMFAPENIAASVVVLFTDIAFVVFLARSQLVKDIFAEFPEKAGENPAPRLVSSERVLAEEVARERRLALLAQPIIENLPAAAIDVKAGDSELPALEAAARFEAQNRLPEAEAVYRAVLAANPGCADAWHALGLLAFQIGRRTHGFALVEEAIRIDGNSSFYHRNLCEMYRREGRIEEAIRHGEVACRLSPEDAESWHYLGMAQTNAKKVKAAIASYRRVVTLKPDHTQCWNNLGVALQMAGQSDEAEQAYLKVLSLSPNNPEAEVNLSRLKRTEAHKSK